MREHVEYEVAIWRADGAEQEDDHRYFPAGRGGAGLKTARELFELLTVEGDIESIDLRKIVLVDEEPDEELVIASKP